MNTYLANVRMSGKILPAVANTCVWDYISYLFARMRLLSAPKKNQMIY